MFPNPSPRATAWASTAVIAWMRERVAASGGDPSIIPDEPVAFWRLKRVMEKTSLKRTSIWRRVKEGQFPAPVVLRDVTVEVHQS
jgi:predicted DNA-binding transcriptional regulator AlpA